MWEETEGWGGIVLSACLSFPQMMRHLSGLSVVLRSQWWAILMFSGLADLDRPENTALFDDAYSRRGIFFHFKSLSKVPLRQRRCRFSRFRRLAFARAQRVALCSALFAILCGESRNTFRLPFVEPLFSSLRAINRGHRNLLKDKAT